MFIIVYKIGKNPTKCTLYYTFSAMFCHKVRVKPYENCNKIRVKHYDQKKMLKKIVDN